MSAAFHTTRAPRQLPLLPAGDMAPPDDPVGVALGVLDDDSDDPWQPVMDLFARLAVRAYHQAQAEAESEPQC